MVEKHREREMEDGTRAGGKGPASQEGFDSQKEEAKKDQAQRDKA